MAKTILERFLAKCGPRNRDDDGCWEWQGAKIKDGYGHFWNGTGLILAHRWAWQFWVGPIPEGRHILHSCDNPSCVRPSHLFCGSHADNMADMARKGRAASEKKRGASNGRAKLTPEQVAEIRASQVSSLQLAPHYGVCSATIRHARRGLTWS